MEASCFTHCAETQIFLCSTSPARRTRRSLKPSNSLQTLAFSSTQNWVLQQASKSRFPGTKVKCGKWGAGPVTEVEADFDAAEEEEEWFRKWREKCREKEGAVELLECLEREAIMGEHEGKEPTDYNRRARIFDKSSKVFQALKGKETTSHQS